MKTLLLLSVTSAFLMSGHFASAKAACGASSSVSMTETKYDVAYLASDKKGKKPSKVKWSRTITKEAK